jgi:ribosome-associated protein
MTAKETSPADRLDLAPGVWVRESDLRVSFVRSGGPGGQSVNKVSTQAQLRVRIEDLHGLRDAAAARLRRLAGRRLTVDDEILLRSSASRSQATNRRTCVARLRSLVATAARRPKPRKPTRPSRGSIERRLAAKRRQSDAKRRRRRPPDDS